MENTCRDKTEPEFKGEREYVSYSGEEFEGMQF